MSKKNILKILLILLLASCAKTGKIEDVDCYLISINGPSKISVGESAIFNIVGYDQNSAVLKNSSCIKNVDWELQGDNIYIVEKKEKNFVRIKGIKKGMFCIKATYKDHKTYLSVTVE
ncbi:MAG: hypothetical protein ABIN39_06345 [candidate division WOR-3 bacterium]